MEQLALYRQKRNAERTPEPFGGRAIPGANVFVIHMHGATRLHWDLRLEIDGVLWSWAVPKGPSPNPQDKRLAVQVEQHPLEYTQFEALIPEGNYGAGPMIVWDRGIFVPLKDMKEGLEEGKLLFELRGYKCHGKWTLVKTQAFENSWLFIKERDHHVDPRGTDALPMDSILSGLKLDELKQGKRRDAILKRGAKALGALPCDSIDAFNTELMLCQNGQQFDHPDWLFEIKFDGFRVLAHGRNGEVRIRSRNGKDLSASFPEVCQALRRLPCDEFLIDGELVVHDGGGLPSFERLLRRAQVRKEIGIIKASWEMPTTLYAFDLLFVSGLDLRPIPLLERKKRLHKLLPSTGPVSYVDHVLEHGQAMYDNAVQLKLEGLVAKRAGSPYVAGRGDDWQKLSALKTDDFVVIGYRPQANGRVAVGAIHVAQYDGEDLVYCGRVGSGLQAADRKRLEGAKSLLRSEPECAIEDQKDQDVWLEPALVCEVRYKEITTAGNLRQPAFLHWRDDKDAHECQLKVQRWQVEEPEPPEPDEDKQLHFSNLDKVFWPEDGYTKGDLIDYYRAIAPCLLPYLKDRPLVLTRYPDGIHGKSFFQREAPEFMPDWVGRAWIWSEEDQTETPLFLANDLDALLYLINLGAIPLHIWSSRIDQLDKPDWCILDLDPKTAPFTDVVTIARTIDQICDELEIPHYVKTSGSTGLHILLPLGGQLNHEMCRAFGELLARLVVSRLPDIATIARLPDQREGKVYVDFLQNGHGRLIVAPYSARPLVHAPVSMPLRWSEVNKGLTIDKHNLRSAQSRIKRWRADPMAQVLSAETDLMRVFERLTGLLNE